MPIEEKRNPAVIFRVYSASLVMLLILFFFFFVFSNKSYPWNTWPSSLVVLQMFTRSNPWINLLVRRSETISVVEYNTDCTCFSECLPTMCHVYACGLHDPNSSRIARNAQKDMPGLCWPWIETHCWRTGQDTSIPDWYCSSSCSSSFLRRIENSLLSLGEETGWIRPDVCRSGRRIGWLWTRSSGLRNRDGRDLTWLCRHGRDHVGPQCKAERIEQSENVCFSLSTSDLSLNMAMKSKSRNSSSLSCMVIASVASLCLSLVRLCQCISFIEWFSRWFTRQWIGCWCCEYNSERPRSVPVRDQWNEIMDVRRDRSNCVDSWEDMFQYQWLWSGSDSRLRHDGSINETQRHQCFHRTEAHGRVVLG